MRNRNNNPSGMRIRIRKVIAMMTGCLAAVLLMCQGRNVLADDLPAADTPIIAPDSVMRVNKTLSGEGRGPGKVLLEQYAVGRVLDHVDPVDAVLVLDDSGSLRFPYEQGREETRLEALQKSIHTFIDRFDAQNQGLAEDQQSRIAMAEFGDAANDNIRVLTEFTRVSGQGTKDLGQITDELGYGGKTWTDQGMILGKQLLNGDTKEGRRRVLVLFTDGQPNADHGFQPSVANRALETAKEIKQAGSEIYVVSIDANTNFHPGEDLPEYDKAENDTAANPDFYYWDSEESQTYATPADMPYPDCQSNDENVGRLNSRFLYLLSSDNPEASCLDDTGKTYGTAPEESYCYQAHSVQELADTFSFLAGKIDTLAPDAGARLQIRDFVTDDFLLADRSTIHAYTRDRIRGADGSFSWGERTDITKNLQIGMWNQDPNSVTVSGYDYSADFISETEHTGRPGFYGRKLEVEFEIVPAKSFGGNQLPTNRESSGIYPDDQTDTAEILYPLPRTDLPLDYQIQTKDQVVYVPEGAGLASMVGFADGYVPDGCNNRHVSIDYRMMAPDGTLAGSLHIPAGTSASACKWQFENEKAHRCGIYQVDCTVTPVVEGTASQLLLQAAPAAHVYRPILSLQDTRQKNGDPLDTSLGTLDDGRRLGNHFLSLIWKCDDERESVREEEPVLHLRLKALNGVRTENGQNYVDSKTDIPIQVRVSEVMKSSDKEEEITSLVTFSHLCEEKDCEFQKILDAGNPKEVHFLIHVDEAGEAVIPRDQTEDTDPDVKPHDSTPVVNVNVPTPNVTVNQPDIQVQQPEIHVQQPDIYVQQPDVYVTQPEIRMQQPSVTVQPDIHVAQPAVTVQQPDIHLTQPDVNLYQNLPAGTTNVSVVNQTQPVPVGTPNTAANPVRPAAVPAAVGPQMQPVDLSGDFSLLAGLQAASGDDTESGDVSRPAGPSDRRSVTTGDEGNLVLWAIMLCTSFTILVMWMVLSPRGENG